MKWLAVFTVVVLSAGCWSANPDEVVVYAALDREFSEPILEEFTRQSGVRVLAKYDIESTKTVGLTTALIQERNRPRCDLFWNNEILHTLRLQKMGLLEPYLLPDAASFPASYRSPDGFWYGFAARARVLIVNTELVPPNDRPASLRDLIDPRWKDRCGLAKPLFGTTATHMAVLYSQWGSDEAQEFFTALSGNARVLSGNKQVAVSVGQGQLAFGLTDTDDAMIELEQGQPVAIVYPDQHEGGMGTLFIPNTLCIPKGSPHRQHARRLLEFLLTPDVERRLADSASAQFPLHAAVQRQPRVFQERVRWMEVDFQAAANVWDEASRVLRDKFASGE